MFYHSVATAVSLSLPTVLSPSHILQVDVRREDMPVSLTTGHTHQNSGAVFVEQSSLDVEFWINSVLEAEMKKQGLEYRSLMDYDLQLYDVSQNNPT